MVFCLTLHYEGLYGRETLQKFTMAFKAAALESSDIENGDANVICFGPFDIDTRYLDGRDSLEIFLDVSKIQKNNPCIFFKQRDLQYNKKEDKEAISTVALGEEKLSFSHISRHKEVYYKFITDKGQSQATIPSFMLMANDFVKIHQILTLNFFRVLDKMDSAAIRNHIYGKLATLDDKQLAVVLKNIGMSFSDTSEFNFYGAHKIDMSSLLKIKVKDFELNIPVLIASLNKGDIQELKKARENIPTLFTSHRFLDYLLNNISQPAVRAELTELRHKEHSPPQEGKEVQESKTKRAFGS